LEAKVDYSSSASPPIAQELANQVVYRTWTYQRILGSICNRTFKEDFLLILKIYIPVKAVLHVVVMEEGQVPEQSRQSIKTTGDI